MGARGQIKRKDGNHAEIVVALEKAGATVQSLSGLGNGCPDILVGHRRRCYVLEIKRKGGTLTPDQTMWHLAWNGSVSIVTTPEEALAAIGIRSDP